MPSDGVVDPASRDKYLLQVTAGPTYDTSTHTEVAVNGDHAHFIENDVMSCWLKVRIKDYHGLPKASPSTNGYFNHPMHKSDRYSIGFSFVPKKDIAGNDLVTGFDFDHSVKDRLPPGFRYAMRIVTTILDPGIYSDPYSDKPYLYGPALSSFFSFRIGEHTSEIPAEEQLASQLESDGAGVIEEGADGSGQRIRADQHIPAKTSKRRKNFLDPKKLSNFTFEAGRLYQADFFNPYLDFANFALRIPGFSISVVKYIDDKTHQLRFVLKNRGTDEVLFVVIFTLLYGQKLEAELSSRDSQGESQKPAARDEQDEANTRDLYRPETSSSSETKPSRASSVPSSAPESDNEETNVAGASTLANTIYTSFAALGFGRTVSSSESSTAPSNDGTPDQGVTPMEKKVERVPEPIVEDYLRGRHSSVG